MIEYDNTMNPSAPSATSIAFKHYITTGSLFINNTVTSNYDVYNNEIAISNATISGTPPGTYSSGVRNLNFTSTEIEDRQGMYCQIRSVIYIQGTSTQPTATIKLKGFVYRSSRSVGSSTTAPANPIREESI
jgi:hypothetical protein